MTVPRVIESGARFEGLLCFESSARVEGELVGSVLGDGLLEIGRSARVEGSIDVAVLRVEGDVSQSLASDGLVKAAVVVLDTGATSIVVRSFNNLPGGAAITVSEAGVGVYNVDFGANIGNRFVQGTLGGGVNSSNGELSVQHFANVLQVRTVNFSGFVGDIPSFTLLVY